MQQHHVALGHLLQGLEHGLEAQPVGVRIVVGIAGDLQPRGGKDAAVVGPGGLAEPQGGPGVHRAQELPAHAQGPRAAGGVHGGRAALADDGVARAEHERLHHPGVALVPADAQVVLGVLLLQQHALGLLDRGQHRVHAGLVLVDPRGEVDLLRVAVLAVGLRQAQDGVRRRRLDGGERAVGHGCFLRVTVSQDGNGYALRHARGRKESPHPPRKTRLTSSLCSSASAEPSSTRRPLSRT